MGSAKVDLIKDEKTRQTVTRHLFNDLKAFEWMLAEDMFDDGQPCIGAEQELCFVDKHWRPAPIVMAVLEDVQDQRFTTEYARFNMEINLDPIPFRGKVLSQLERDLIQALQHAEQLAQIHEAHILQVGILPTIQKSDVHAHNITPLPRYELLTNILHEIRGGMFELSIQGTDHLIDKESHALNEACNTSFQVHLQVHPNDYAPLYNWAQMITAPVLSVAVNSPLFLGKRLWKETRIALFQQSIDFRTAAQLKRSHLPRVTFGSDWIKNSVLELHQDNIARFKAILQTTQSEDSLEILAQGKIPKLVALNIHNGTVYRWNRPCYGISANGKPHLRIENRVIPSGPTNVDQVANAAFWLGLMRGMPDEYAHLHQKIPFDCAKGNFAKAAKQGLETSFNWVGFSKPITAQELILKELLPIAREGLAKAQVAPEDAEKYLDIIAERTQLARTGARWLLESFDKLRQIGKPDEAIVATTAGLYHRQQTNEPVHTWDLAELSEGGGVFNRYATVGQLMEQDVYTVNEDDSLDLVVNVMNWRKIRHLPVENNQGQLVGLISARQILALCTDFDQFQKAITIKEVMVKNLITVPPETSTLHALELMKMHKIGCLLVMEDEKLLGIVTEHDFTMAFLDVWQEMLKDNP